MGIGVSTGCRAIQLALVCRPVAELFNGHRCADRLARCSMGIGVPTGCRAVQWALVCRPVVELFNGHWCVKAFVRSIDNCRAALDTFDRGVQS